MLQSYLNDWATARKNAVILEEKKDENGNLMLQRAEVVFQGVKVEIRNKRVIGAPGPKADDKFCAEFFVPSTITLIDAFRNSEYPSTEFIATLLEAIDPNFNSTQRDAIAKRRESIDQFMSSKKEEWATYFTDTMYTEDDVKFIMNFAMSLLKHERIDNVTTYLKLMAKYQADILNNNVARTSFDGKDITNKDILFDMLCRCCSKRLLAEEHKFVVGPRSVEYIFLDESRDDKLPDYVMNAINILRAIYADCNNSCNVFTPVAYGIASFYAHIFNEPIAYRLAKVSDRRNRKSFREDVVSVDAMMSNIGFAFEDAKPIKRKGKRG
jgi:hypothetical protein